MNFEDKQLQQDIDNIVLRNLRSLRYAEMVRRDFRRLSSSFDSTVTSSVRETQSIFDNTLAIVERLEADQKVLASHLNSHIAADVIVLDDDDGDPEPPKREKVENTAQLIKKRLRSTQAPGDLASAFKDSPDSEPDPDSHGLYVGLRVYGKKQKAEWRAGVIIDIQPQDGKRRYKVRFDGRLGKMRLTANHLACIDTPQRYSIGQIPRGSRIAAHYKHDGIYSGIVAETPDRKVNGGRFLVFFDDGYAMYCPISTVYLIYGPPANVWEDIAYKQTADYVKEFLSTNDHPMLSLRTNHLLKVEFQGEWHEAKCVSIDCSLVEVMYLIDNSREWIYRGSLRLEPLFKQHKMKAKAMQNKSQKKLARAHTGKRGARIEYPTVDLTRDSSPSPSNSPTRHVDERKKNIGKKSTGGVQKNQTLLSAEVPGVGRSYKNWHAPWERRPSAGSVTNSEVTRLPRSFSELKGRVDVASHILDRMSQKPSGKRENLRSNSYAGSNSDDSKFGNNRRRNVSGRKNDSEEQSSVYCEHICGRKCVEPFQITDPKKLIGVNPLSKPLCVGWTRAVAQKHPASSRGAAFHVFYRTPCNRMCRNMGDIDRYMVETGLTDLDYNEFCFDSSVRTQNHIPVKPPDAKYFMEDYSDGKEDVPVSCVNELSAEPPPKMPYTKRRVPGTGVEINTSTDFMVCCDCPDNCRDRSKCPCQQLTVTATTCCKGAKMKQDAGYVYKRLYNFLPTGIYECNSKCKCNSRCPNRVVQRGLQCRLQMFKTPKKGWGIRCLDDIAKGTFVCVYTGKIQHEEQANEEGLAYGDEYLAELDHIEVAERQKDIDDAASSSGVSDDDEFDDDEVKKKTKIDKSNDSFAETTDSDSDGGERMKVTTTTDAKNSVDGGAKKIFSNGRKRSKCTNRGSSDSDIDPSNGYSSKLSPPKRNDDDDDTDDTTDTDTDSSTNDTNGPSSAGLPSNRGHNASSQNLGLNSSQDSPYEELDDDGSSVSQTRKYFGTSDTFMIDAKQTGNLGRYLNHSCSPNLLVQNVFIDTHDLRFPWVAFFANSTIRGGAELTWDYNYEIGSVEGREIVCYCGATKCRKRLL